MCPALAWQDHWETRMHRNWPIKGRNILNDIRFIWTCLWKTSAKRGVYIAHDGYRNLGDEALREAIYALFAQNKIVMTQQKGLLLRLLQRLKIFKFHFVML